jgi:hypothetical protein
MSAQKLYHGGAEPQPKTLPLIPQGGTDKSTDSHGCRTGLPALYFYDFAMQAIALLFVIYE